MTKKLLLIGVAALTLSAHAQDRVSLIETFTSSTCPPCNPGNVNLEGLLNEVQNKNNFVSLKYQMSWPPPGDAYYTEEAGDRRNVYGITGVPTSQVDGQTAVSTTSMVQGDMDAAIAIASKATINAVYSVDEAAQTVNIDVDVEMLENTMPGVRVYMAIFEYGTTNNTGSNGETSFEHVMKKMVPSVSGVVMPPMQAGESYHTSQSYTFNGSYSLPANAQSPTDHSTEHSVEEFSDLGVAVWVQTLFNKEVYQATYAKLVAGVDEMDNAIASVKLYPNPAKNNATIAFQSVEILEEAQIEVFNVLGQQVFVEDLGSVEAGRTVHSLDTSSFKSGVYTVKISSEKGELSKRLIVE